MQPDKKELENTNDSNQSEKLEASSADLEAANGGSLFDVLEVGDLAKFGRESDSVASASRSERSVLEDISNHEWDGAPVIEEVSSVDPAGWRDSEVIANAPGRQGLTPAQKAAIAGGAIAGGGAVGGGIYGLVDYFKNKDKSAGE